MKTIFVKRGFNSFFTLCSLAITLNASAQGGGKDEILKSALEEKPFNGEILLTYISTRFYPTYDWNTGDYVEVPESALAVKENFQRIGFKSKRLGFISYDNYGNMLNDEIPVFIKEDEYRQYLKQFRSPKKFKKK